MSHPKSFEDLGERYDGTRQVPAAPLRKALLQALPSFPPADGIDSFLEVGCGTGQIVSTVLDRCRRVVGIDVALAPLLRARSRLKHGHCVLASGCQLPFPRAAFQSVLIAHVLEHVSEWKTLIRESHRVLAEDGALLFLFSPGFVRNRPRSLLKEELRRRGWKIRRPGIHGSSEVEEHLKETVGPDRIEKLRDPAWTWIRTVSIRESLSVLERREYSVFWDVPDSLYRESLSAVRRDLEGVIETVEKIEARLEMWVVTKAREGEPSVFR